MSVDDFVIIPKLIFLAIKRFLNDNTYEFLI